MSLFYCRKRDIQDLGDSLTRMSPVILLLQFELLMNDSFEFYLKTIVATSGDSYLMNKMDVTFSLLH